MTGSGAPATGRDAPAIRFVPLRNATLLQRAAFLAIYREALPPSERKADDTVLAMAGRADCVLELAEMDGAAVGFLILYRAQAHPIALLEYLGVSASARSGGLGRRVFARIAALTHGRTLLMEVETDRDLAAPDREQRLRRKRFYAQQGCRQLAHLSYIMPTLGDETPPPMDLLALTDLDMVDRATIRAWIGDIYRHVYDQPQDHPAIARMIENLPDRLALQPIRGAHR